MFSKLRALFRGPEEPKEPEAIAFEDLKAWLDDREEAIQSELSLAFTAPEADIGNALDQLEVLIEDLEKDPVHMDDGILLHPKVKSVLKTAKPQTIRSLNQALEKRPSGDPEAFYTASAELLKSVITTAKGPGKYLHLVYKEEMPRLRQIIKDIGHAVNDMSKALDEAKKERETIRSIRELHDTLNRLTDSVSAAEERIRTSETRAATLLEEILSAEEELGTLPTDHLKETIARAEKEVESALQGYAQVRAPVAAVVRRAEKLLKRHKAPTEPLRQLHDLAESPIPRPDLAEEIEPALESIQSLIRSGELQLKNREEQQLFGDGNLAAALEKATAVYTSAEAGLQQAKAVAEADPTYQRERELQDHLANQKKEHDRAVADGAAALEEKTRRLEESARHGEELQALLRDYAGVACHLR